MLNISGSRCRQSRARSQSRIVLYPGHHRCQPVRALRSEMIVEAKLGENRLFVGLENFPRCLPRIKRKKDSDKPADDVRVALAAKLEPRIGAASMRLGNKPDLAR